MKNKREFNLIDQAIHKLDNAENYYKRIDRDTMHEDYIIRDCCLELQISVELFVKGLVEQLCGTNYEHKHEYYENINKIKANKKNIKNYEELEKILDDIDDKAEIITKWHTHALYIAGFKTTIRQIDDVMNIARRLKVYCFEVVKNNTDIFDA